MDPGDATPSASGGSTEAADASTFGLDPSDDPAARRVALRDLAAMIGVEVFY